MPKKNSNAKADALRRFEAEALALQSLIAGVNPNPQDDLSEAKPAIKPLDPRYSIELINQLIDFIKTI